MIKYIIMIESIGFGILQGLTEFLPVSSSGHIFFAGKLSVYPAYNLPLMVSIHAGTALAIVFYFRKLIQQMILSLLKMRDVSYIKERKLWKYLLIASIPAGIAGITLEKFIEKISTVTTRWSLLDYKRDYFNLWRTDKSEKEGTKT